MKKRVAILLALGLVVGLVGPAVAKKKPRRPVSVQADQTYYFVNANADGGCATEGFALELAPVGGGASCGSAFAGAPHAACDHDASFVGCGDLSFPATEGLPLTLDASRKVTGKVLVRSYTASGVPAGLSAGAATLNGALRVTVDGEEAVLGTFSADYTVTPLEQSYEVPFEVEVPADLDRRTVAGFAVDVWNSGATVLHGFYTVDDSTVVLPVSTPSAPARP